ncbi:MAG: thioesterase family protein [Euryarchaeota archaeon]|jgi:fluoroacetyl-CoA thioesterase|nr:thioesterase family protein [Euryarchaeota archaeon]
MLMIPAGVVSEIRRKVTEDDTARVWGSGTLDVYATPAMALLVEETAAGGVEPFMADGMTTVGVRLDIAHTAPSPVGIDVVCRTELIEVDGPKLVFKATIHDSAGKIGEGLHERYIVDPEAFMPKAASRLPE